MRMVSNSWGGPPSSTYQSAINSMDALGIKIVFSAGNSGPSCQTMTSPGDYTNVISVGSTTIDNALSSFSSCGQCNSGLIAPTIVAPGSDILSAWKTSDTAYRAISGTSMACPHVSGLAALMLKKNPGLSFNQLKSAITSGAQKANLVTPNQSCGGTTASQWPNNMLGYGRIDCEQTMKLI
ncbi:unnamed protein product [Orchesella dallaii]|uniref:Peptidase S8/S53 domain-containing protein n=1 Tax=Orchesella dallaii TaxID=48710 RepID=A0ABP1RKL6_9HEXA